MSRIFKHTLPPGATALSGIVKVLGVGWQKVDDGRMRGEELRLWAETDPDDPTETVFYAALTGEAPPPDAEHVGTAVGSYVIHVYRQVRA